MARGMSKADKAADYDRLKAENTKHELALYDLANHRFGLSVRLTMRDFTGGDGVFSMRMSWRGMPLFLVKECRTDGDVRVYTDSEIQDMYREYQDGFTRMLLSGRDQLVHKHMEKVA